MASTVEGPIVLSWDTWKTNYRTLVTNKHVFDDDCTYLENKRVARQIDRSSYTPGETHLIRQWAPVNREGVIRRIATTELNSSTISTLIMQAQIARTHTYSPYSHYAVGAALLTSDGQIFTGCNVENAAYSPTVCAERTALLKAISELNEAESAISGEIRFTACAIVLRSGGSPCGVCRQMLNEANPDMMIYMVDIDGEIKHQMLLQDLLPLAFGPHNL